MIPETSIRKNFARQTLMVTFGATLDSLSKGAATISAPILANTTQQQGFSHGGVAFSLGDSAAGYAAVTLLDADQDVVTSEMHIHFLAPGQGERLIARGQVIKPGRRLIVASSDVYAINKGVETHIARLTGTLIPVTPR